MANFLKRPRILTGIKDIDLKIIAELNDYELGKVCSVNKYIKSLCNDNNFWRNRAINFFIIKEHAFENFSQLNNFRGEKSWKDYYKYLRQFVNSYINGKVNAASSTPQDLRQIIYRFISNSDEMILLLDAKKYKQLDQFLDTHYLISPANAAIYVSADEEQTEYLFNRSRFDKRFSPYISKIALDIFTDDDYKYKILLNYVDPNWLLELLFNSPGLYRLYIDRFIETLSHIKKEDLRRLLVEDKVPIKFLPYVKKILE